MNGNMSQNDSLNKGSRIATYLQAFRFRSWIGWLFIFGLGSTLFAIPVENTIPISVSFSSITAAIFVLNQYFDRESDTLNPEKKNLPIASGELSKKFALLLFVSLFAIGLFVIAAVDISLVFLFALYIGLWVLYSTPPVYLKKRPILDLFVAGVGSGVLPFMIGLQVSHQLTLEFSLPWIIRRYEAAFACVIPIFLFQVSTHIFQAVGDYAADKEGNITTFVVKYGKERAAKIGVLLVSLSLTFPIVYALFNLAVAEEFVIWYSVLFLFFLPLIIYLLSLSMHPTGENMNSLLRISYRFTPFFLICLYVCIFVLRLFVK